MARGDIFRNSNSSPIRTVPRLSQDSSSFRRQLPGFLLRNSISFLDNYIKSLGYFFLLGKVSSYKYLSGILDFFFLLCREVENLVVTSIEARLG